MVTSPRPAPPLRPRSLIQPIYPAYLETTDVQVSPVSSRGFAPLQSHMRKVLICGNWIELRKSTSGLTAHNSSRNALL